MDSAHRNAHTWHKYRLPIRKPDAANFGSPYCAASLSDLWAYALPLSGRLFLDAPSLHGVNSYHSLGLGVSSILPNLGALPCYTASLFSNQSLTSLGMKLLPVPGEVVTVVVIGDWG